jgi:hypothetical protein
VCGCTRARSSGRSSAPSDPKAEAGREPAGDGGDVERYEQLRRRALAGDPSGWRLGLALLERRGVAAWARTCQTALPAPPARPSRPAVEASRGGQEIVGVLATMALACLSGS